jgi:hypothetical protein
MTTAQKSYKEIVQEYGGILIILKDKNGEKKIYSEKIIDEFRAIGYSPDQFRKDIVSADPLAYSRAKYFLAKAEEKLDIRKKDAKLGLIIEIEDKYELLQLDPITGI